MKLIFRYHPQQKGVQKCLNCRKERRMARRDAMEMNGSRTNTKKPRSRVRRG